MACNLKLDPPLLACVCVCARECFGCVKGQLVECTSEICENSPTHANVGIRHRRLRYQNASQIGKKRRIHEKTNQRSGIRRGCSLMRFLLCRVHSTKVDLQMMANKYFNPSWCIVRSDVINLPVPVRVHISTSKVSNDFGKCISIFYSRILKSKSGEWWRHWLSCDGPFLPAAIPIARQI